MHRKLASTLSRPAADSIPNERRLRRKAASRPASAATPRNLHGVVPDVPGGFGGTAGFAGSRNSCIVKSGPGLAQPGFEPRTRCSELIGAGADHFLEQAIGIDDDAFEIVHKFFLAALNVPRLRVSSVVIMPPDINEI